MTQKRAKIEIEEDFFADEEEKHPLENFVKNSQARIITLKIDQIKQNPEQPRKSFDQKKLEGLAESIKTKGQLQPIIVKEIEDNKFIIVAGERRWRAHKLAGLTKIQALITEDNELEIALIENIQRENLSPIEEAEGLQLLVDKFQHTHEKLAKIINKSRTSITKTLSLNKLPDEIKADCATSHNYSKEQLLQVVRQENKEKMLSLWQQVKDNNLTVRETRKVAKGKKTPVKKTLIQQLIKDSEKIIKQFDKTDLTDIKSDEKEKLTKNWTILVEKIQGGLSRFNK